MHDDDPNPQKRATGNGQRATGNADPGPAQKQATGNRQQATGNSSLATPASLPRPALRIGSNLAQRLLRFAARVLRLAKVLPKDAPGRHVTGQVVRSATSAGANYEEARAAESGPDFVHKLAIAHKEMRETSYWLALIQEAELIEHDISPLLREASELGAILGASIRTARAR